jgi:hypothetical protein
MCAVGLDAVPVVNDCSRSTQQFHPPLPGRGIEEYDGAAARGSGFHRH